MTGATLYEFACGSAAESAENNCVKLSLSGELSNVRLDISGISDTLYANLSQALKDLIRIATFVTVGDQTISRGDPDVIDLGRRWRRHFVYSIGVTDPKDPDRYYLLKLPPERGRIS